MFGSGALIFLLLPFVSSAPANAGTDGKAKALPNAVSWSKAVSGCRELGPDYSVPVIKDQSDLPVLQKAMTSLGISQTWLALKRERFPTYVWLDGQPIGKKFTTQNWKDHMICGDYHLRDEMLEVDNCSISRYGYICEGPKPCSAYPVNPVDCMTMPDRVLIYGCYASSWYDARHRCRKMGTDLAVLRSAEDQRNISRQWHELDKKHCIQLWVGLRQDEWRQQGKPVPDSVPPSWAPGQPSHVGDCAVVTTGGPSGLLWQAANCEQPRRTLCVESQTKQIGADLTTMTTKTEYTTTESTTVLKKTDPPTSARITTNSPGMAEVNHTTPPSGLSGGAIAGIVIGVIVFLVIVVVIGCILWKRSRGRNKGDRYLWWGKDEAKNRPISPGTLDIPRASMDGGMTHTLTREPFQPLMSFATEGSEVDSEPTGLTAILVAEFHRMAAGRATHDEITLRIYALKALQYSDIHYDIEDLAHNTKGVVIRKDLHLDLPEKEVNKQYALHTELSLDDHVLQIKGTTSREMKLAQLLTSTAGQPGRMVAEFVVTGNGKKKLQNFRINLKFSWKSDQSITPAAEYTEVIDRKEVKITQAAQAKHSNSNATISLPTTARMSRQGSFSSFRSAPVTRRTEHHTQQKELELSQTTESEEKSHSSRVSTEPITAVEQLAVGASEEGSGTVNCSSQSSANSRIEEDPAEHTGQQAENLLQNGTLQTSNPNLTPTSHVTDNSNGTTTSVPEGEKELKLSPASSSTNGSDTEVKDQKLETEEALKPHSAEPLLNGTSLPESRQSPTDKGTGHFKIVNNVDEVDSLKKTANGSVSQRLPNGPEKRVITKVTKEEKFMARSPLEHGGI